MAFRGAVNRYDRRDPPTHLHPVPVTPYPHYYLGDPGSLLAFTEFSPVSFVIMSNGVQLKRFPDRLPMPRRPPSRLQVAIAPKIAAVRAPKTAVVTPIPSKPSLLPRLMGVLGVALAVQFGAAAPPAAAAPANAKVAAPRKGARESRNYKFEDPATRGLQSWITSTGQWSKQQYTTILNFYTGVPLRYDLRPPTPTPKWIPRVPPAVMDRMNESSQQ